MRVVTTGGHLSQRGYAESRKARKLPGGSLAAVQKAIKTGRIRLVAGKIDAAAADSAWDQRAAPDSITRRDSPQLSARPEAPPPAAAPAEFRGDALERFQNSRAEREEYRAKTEKLDLAAREGSLIDAAEESDRDAARAAIVKEHVLNFASEFAPRIAATLGCDERRLYNEIDRAMREHLFQIAQALQPKNDPSTPEADLGPSHRG